LFFCFFVFEKVETTNQDKTTNNSVVRLVKLLQNEKQELNKEQTQKLPKQQPAQSQNDNQPKKQVTQTQKEIIKELNPLVDIPKKVQAEEPIKQIQPEPKVLNVEKPKDVAKDIKIDNKQVVTKDTKIDNITKSYLELYKDDFDTFSEETKVYLLKNLKDIGFITERYLIYPHLSIDAKQQGLNVIEFWLYPDGKISKPKTIKSSSYFLLDDNSEETIMKAYRDYPRPQKPTVIRIYVKYKFI